MKVKCLLYYNITHNIVEWKAKKRGSQTRSKSPTQTQKISKVAHVIRFFTIIPYQNYQSDFQAWHKIRSQLIRF